MKEYAPAKPNQSLNNKRAGVKIDRLVAEKVEFTRFVTHAVLSQELHGLIERRTRRLVVVKEVAAEQDKVDFSLLRDLKDFCESIDRVF